MAPSCLPQELIDAVADIIAQDGSVVERRWREPRPAWQREALAACTLASRAWSARSSFHLLDRVFVKNVPLWELIQDMKTSNRLLSRIRSLVVSGEFYPIAIQDLADVLQSCVHLRNVLISDCGPTSAASHSIAPTLFRRQIATAVLENPSLPFMESFLGLFDTIETLVVSSERCHVDKEIDLDYREATAHLRVTNLRVRYASQGVYCNVRRTLSPRHLRSCVSISPLHCPRPSLQQFIRDFSQSLSEITINLESVFIRGKPIYATLSALPNLNKIHFMCTEWSLVRTPSDTADQQAFIRRHAQESALQVLCGNRLATPFRSTTIMVLQLSCDVGIYDADYAAARLTTLMDGCPALVRVAFSSVYGNDDQRRFTACNMLVLRTVTDLKKSLPERHRDKIRWAPYASILPI